MFLKENIMMETKSNDQRLKLNMSFQINKWYLKEVLIQWYYDNLFWNTTIHKHIQVLIHSVIIRHWSKLIFKCDSLVKILDPGGLFFINFLSFFVKENIMMETLVLFANIILPDTTSQMIKYNYSLFLFNLLKYFLITL